MNMKMFMSALDDLIDLHMRAIDIVMEDIVDPVADVGSPEKLLGKPYEQWTPNDLQMMMKIYGAGDDTPLSNLIFRKMYARVKELEQEEMGHDESDRLRTFNP